MLVPRNVDLSVLLNADVHRRCDVIEGSPESEHELFPLDFNTEGPRPLPRWVCQREGAWWDQCVPQHRSPMLESGRCLRGVDALRPVPPHHGDVPAAGYQHRLRRVHHFWEHHSDSIERARWLLRFCLFRVGQTWKLLCFSGFSELGKPKP